MQNQRIAVMQVLEATVGGTRQHIRDLCLGLSAAEFRLHLVCSLQRDHRFGDDLKTLQAAGVEVTVLPMTRSIAPATDWQCLQQLRRLIQSWQPQIVHGHSSKGGYLARLAARAQRRRQPDLKVVYNPHGFAFQMYESPMKQAFYRGLEQLAGRWTDCLVAVGAGQGELAVRQGIVPAQRVRVIPGGIDLSLYQHPRGSGRLQHELGLPQDTPLVGTVAALSPQKGLSYLLRAVARITHEVPGVHFVVVGEGRDRQQLRGLRDQLGVGEVVHLLGQRDDVPRLLADLQLFVLPSLWEGLPYALLEAGASGLPVVVTDIPGNRDLVVDRVTGRLVPPGEAAVLGEVLREALQAPEARQWGEALRQRVAAGYTLAGMIAGHAQLYRELAG
jgi:glycosyltransferase involved in cell wall biosynthesis